MALGTTPSTREYGEFFGLLVSPSHTRSVQEDPRSASQLTLRKSRGSGGPGGRGGRGGPARLMGSLERLVFPSTR